MPSSAAKRLILCLDGTWAGAHNKAKRLEDGHTVLKPTNPLKLCRAVVPVDETTGRRQIAYYHTGVGGLSLYRGFGNRLLYGTDRILGGLTGAGFEENVEGALHFLTLNLEPDDEVFIFGFSRGAATARAVTRFLEWNRGLPEKEDAYYLPVLFRAYVESRGATGRQEPELSRINAERQAERRPLAPLKPIRPVHVKYLGLWDTVMALGGRFEATSESTSSPTQTFYAGKAPAAPVEHARQALAVDEHRWDFRPEIWTERLSHQDMQQRWFAGVHANVGGGYVHDGLANLAFHWVIDGATQQGLKIDRHFIAPYEGFARDSLYESYSLMFGVSEFFRGHLGKGKRSLVGWPPEANLDMDLSVIDRMKTEPANLRPGNDDEPVAEPYRPENVLEFLARQPNLDTYLKRIGILDGANSLPQDVLRRVDDLKMRKRVAETEGTK